MISMDVFMLNVADYISPECTCNVDDMAAKLDHVSSVEFNPLTQVLKVTAHQGMITRGALIKHLEDCGVRCSNDAPEGMTHEHGAQGMDMAAHSPGHDHHARACAIKSDKVTFAIKEAIYEKTDI